MTVHFLLNFFGEMFFGISRQWLVPLFTA